MKRPITCIIFAFVFVEAALWWSTVGLNQDDNASERQEVAIINHIDSQSTRVPTSDAQPEPQPAGTASRGTEQEPRFRLESVSYERQPPLTPGELGMLFAATDNESLASPDVGAAMGVVSKNRATRPTSADLQQPTPPRIVTTDMSGKCVQNISNYCYHHKMDVCRWHVNPCNFSGEDVNLHRVLANRTIVFRGDSTLRELFGDFSDNGCCPRGPAVAKQQANRTHRTFSHRWNSEYNVHLFYKFDFELSHFAEGLEEGLPPISHINISALPKFNVSNSSALIAPPPRSPDSPATRRPNKAQRKLKEASQQLSASPIYSRARFERLKGRQIDAVVLSAGVYEAMANATRDPKNDTNMLEITNIRKHFPAIVRGVCKVLNASVGIFYAQTLDCRVLRPGKAKGSTKARYHSCLDGLRELRKINIELRKYLLAHRYGVPDTGGGDDETSVGHHSSEDGDHENKKRSCQVFFIPPFHCSGTAWFCTNDGLHARPMGNLLRTKRHILAQALASAFNDLT